MDKSKIQEQIERLLRPLYFIWYQLLMDPLSLFFNPSWRRVMLFTTLTRFFLTIGVGMVSYIFLGPALEYPQKWFILVTAWLIIYFFKQDFDRDESFPDTAEGDRQIDALVKKEDRWLEFRVMVEAILVGGVIGIFLRPHG